MHALYTNRGLSHCYIGPASHEWTLVGDCDYQLVPEDELFDLKPWMPYIPTIAEWADILAVAYTFRFDALAQHARQAIDLSLPPIDKICLGQDLRIPALAIQGYREMCSQPHLPTLTAAKFIGLEILLRLAELRENMRYSDAIDAVLLSDDQLSFALGLHLHGVERAPEADNPLFSPSCHSEDADSEPSECCSELSYFSDSDINDTPATSPDRSKPMGTMA
ncbi:hypothetical protein HWV62_34141 [Athelia sp. TMB]|nr:hypothetical protein HWV62_34141 [Athelia sp. TMB]